MEIGVQGVLTVLRQCSHRTNFPPTPLNEPWCETELSLSNEVPLPHSTTFLQVVQASSHGLTNPTKNYVAVPLASLGQSTYFGVCSVKSSKGTYGPDDPQIAHVNYLPESHHITFSFSDLPI